MSERESPLQLRCFVCEKSLDSVHEDTVQPYFGLVFSSGGNYGSGIFDPLHGKNRLVITICDECVTERLERVFVQAVKRVPDNVTYTKPTSVQDIPE